jgi:hypothetical protein
MKTTKNIEKLTLIVKSATRTPFALAAAESILDPTKSFAEHLDDIAEKRYDHNYKTKLDDFTLINYEYIKKYRDATTLDKLFLQDVEKGLEKENISLTKEILDELEEICRVTWQSAAIMSNYTM